ncbi:MAG: NAD-dependent epimerase/dehydratase family protein [Lentilactobacillus hilgardii]|uniref:NAD-dependent epimerase/dehydratase family protein n=1 Tax=Lentilactobacillus hilgardii TaxID=1588 RepID=UPI001CC20806|nr:NAD-dependent epimerase/dehydratase family protein [Lentilactobacillus hilgardii]MBZ2200798.1 NAD-dependent dehydratase [Lentilactobacillus hilgardii]MBZ2203797.1 NAD-dependent dehydratase [Lentilactobacillus hilgardii]
MQTILGSNGQIGQELAKELTRHYTQDIRLVSRHPRKVNSGDQLVPANLLDFNETNQAIAGSDIVYFTVGLPNDSATWEAQFPIITENVLKACEANHSKLVFFDNTYMYAKTNQPQTEESPFLPMGRKSVVRAQMASMVLQEMSSGKLTAVICRAPEFYGPGKTKSITNNLIFNNIIEDKLVKIPVSDQTLRTLIWTPDASRAIALIGNTADAYDQTWHLPTADSLTYHDLILLSQRITGKSIKAIVIKPWIFKLAGFFNRNARELQELLPRYTVDNIFLSDKFKRRFPDFHVTSIQEGIRAIVQQ